MSLKFTILGCGYSLGVPRIDGNFGSCDPKNKKNFRTRCSALISLSNLNILIDTSPDLRFQLIKNKIKNIDKVFYTHAHADQTHGINDLRVFYLKNNNKLPVFADKKTQKYLLNAFKYCFKNTSEYPPILSMNNLKNKHVFINNKKKIILKSFSVQHGKINSICYVINNKCAYISDVSKIYNKDFKFFKNLNYLVLDCLWYNYHPSHYNLENSLLMIKKFKPKNAILTNLSVILDYKKLKKLLPKNVIPAHDGLTISL